MPKKDTATKETSPTPRPMLSMVAGIPASSPRGLTFHELGRLLSDALTGDGSGGIRVSAKDAVEVDRLIDVLMHRADGSDRQEIARCPKGAICPRCGSEDMQFPALSRIDNRTHVCPACGEVEAFEFSRGPRGSPSEDGGRLLTALTLTLYQQRRASEELRSRTGYL